MKYIIELLLILIVSSIETGIQSAEKLEAGSPAVTVSENVFRYEYAGNTTEECTYIDIDSSKPVLLVGDSRTVGFYFATKCNDFSYIAKGSMGYSWLVKGTDLYNPADLIACYIEANPTGTIVFNLGINDLANKSKYADWVTDFVIRYPSITFCYMSVNPAKGRGDLDIVGFNEYMKENLPECVVWLDSYSYLEEIGFSTGDGVHYNNETYIDIRNFIIDSVGDLHYE